jgi:hypothetical protein
MKKEKAKAEAEIVGEYGPSPVSKKLETAVRERAGDYLANRILRDHRLPRQEMPEKERSHVLMEFIEAMSEYLGKEETQEILAEVGREKRLPVRPDRTGRERPDDRRPLCE